MKKIKHYTERVPSDVKNEYRKLLGIKLGWFATYADLLDKLWEKGYWVELNPFHTFSFNDKLGVIYKLYKRTEWGDHFWGEWKCLFNEEIDWSSDEGFGCSFYYAMNTLTIREIKRDKESQLPTNEFVGLPLNPIGFETIG